MYHVPVLWIHSGTLFPRQASRCLYTDTKSAICPDPFTSYKVKGDIILYSCLIFQVTEKECLLLALSFGRKDYTRSDSGSNRKETWQNFPFPQRFALQFPNRSLSGVFTLSFHYCPCLTDVNSATELSVFSVTQGNCKIQLLEYVAIHLCLHNFFLKKDLCLCVLKKKKREGWFPVEFWSMANKLI